LWLFTLGVLVSVLYYFLQRAKEEDKIRREEFPLLREREFERRRLEHQALNEGVKSRETSTLIAGSIVLTASVLILVEGLSRPLPRPLLVPTVLTSLSLYAVWLLFAQATAARIDNICYARMREIEGRLGMEIHRYIRDEIEREKWYRFGRQKLWLFLFWILLIFGTIILVLKL